MWDLLIIKLHKKDAECQCSASFRLKCCCRPSETLSVRIRRQDSWKVLCQTNAELYDISSIFTWCTSEGLCENVIAKNTLSQVDGEGNIITLANSIVDYKRDDSEVDKSNKYVFTRIGKRRLRNNSQGCKLLVEWNYEYETWINLKDMDESNTIDVAEFAKAKGINEELDFTWWLPYTLSKRNFII